MEEQKTQTRKVNAWVVSTLILGFICLVLIINQFVLQPKQPIDSIAFENETNTFTIEQLLCSRIQGTPAYGDANGNIVFQGYTTFGNQSWNVVEKLIEDKIYFLYSPSCSWCQEQIKYFGTTWQTYVDSGLTVDCTEFK